MKVFIYLAVSANGLISNERNIPDWLSPEFAEDFMTVSGHAKAVIMGKNTYDHLSPDHLPFKGGSIVVLTHHTDTAPSQSNVLFTDHDPKEIISHLAAKGHTEALIIGGTQTLTQFVKADVVDEIILVIHPILFGSGLPITHGLEFEKKLSLLTFKKLNDHTLKLHYETIK